MVSASAGPPNGSMRGRRLAGVIALVALTLAVAGCGIFSGDDAPEPATISTTVPAGSDDALTDADAALCQVAEVLHDVDPDATFERALTGTDDDVESLLLAVGLFVSGRGDDVGRLGAYEPGIRAIARRWDQHAAPSETAPDDRPLPRMAPTRTERASIEAADRFLADDRCPA